MTSAVRTEQQDLARAREKLFKGREELDRIQGALGRLEGLYEEHRRTYARARLRGASERELGDIAQRGRKLKGRVEKGREYVPAERARLDRDEEAIRAHEEALERSGAAGRNAADPSLDRDQEARRERQQQRVLGRLQDGREVEEYRRLTRGGLSAEEARERVILARDGGQAPGRELQPDTERPDAEPEAAPTDARYQQEERIGMREAAKVLGVSATTVGRRIQRGELDAVKNDRGRIMVRLNEQDRDDDHEMEC